MQFNRKQSFLAAFAFTVVSAGTYASATTIQTSTVNAWDTTSLTSNGVELPAWANNTMPSVNAFDAEMLTSLVGNFIVTGPDKGGTALTVIRYAGFQALTGSTDGAGTVNVSTPGSGIDAFLLGIGITGSTAPVTVTLSDGETFTVSPAVGGTGVLGLSVSHPITSINLSTATGTAVVLDDFYYGNSNIPPDATGPAAASEGTTIMLVGGGLLVFLGARRKLLPTA